MAWLMFQEIFFVVETVLNALPGLSVSISRTVLQESIISCDLQKKKQAERAEMTC